MLPQVTVSIAQNLFWHLGVKNSLPTSSPNPTKTIINVLAFQSTKLKPSINSVNDDTREE